MPNFFLLVLALSILSNSFCRPQSGSDLNSLLNSVYKRHLEEESSKKKLTRYTFDRRMDIKESDEDGTLEKQYKMLHRVYQKNPDESRSQLISNSKWEDGKWENVEKKEKDGDHKERKIKFDLSSMFYPENRSQYNYELIKQDVETFIIGVKPKKTDTDKFKGKFWFDAVKFNLVKAELQPSELRTGLKSMNTYIEMKEIGGTSFPVKIVNKIHVSVFLIYSGKIDQTTYLENYKFDVDEKSFNDTYSKLK